MGIAEEILASLRRIESLLANQGSAGPATQPAQTVQTGVAIAQPTDPLGGLGAAPAPVVQNVTPDMLQELVVKHVENPAIKEAMGNAMRDMGIPTLPDVQPHQLAPLYAAFQQIVATFTSGTAQPAAASII